MCAMGQLLEVGSPLLPCRQSFPCFCHLATTSSSLAASSLADLPFWVPHPAPPHEKSGPSGPALYRVLELGSHCQVFTADAYLLILLAGPCLFLFWKLLG